MALLKAQSPDGNFISSSGTSCKCRLSQQNEPAGKPKGVLGEGRGVRGGDNTLRYATTFDYPLLRTLTNTFSRKIFDHGKIISQDFSPQNLGTATNVGFVFHQRDKSSELVMVN
ncbi:hypothetical protein TNCV_4638221 [Trichonephila clavipes]|uniref:Uncharacterized protein n=1 Tax=Trichonephila clavipes TaxID=2585209 RepID=A0A8X7BI79_TRICX|nr:hypothetical protein TNCV_4638221 [Trichonephila clavipes]